MAFNGFAAKLTESEATRLAHASGVLRVWENEVLEADTISTPDFPGFVRSEWHLGEAVRRS